MQGFYSHNFEYLYCLVFLINSIFYFRAQEPEKAMENASVMRATVENFVNSALVDFTILIETTRKFFALPAIVPAKTCAHKLGRKVA